MRRVWLYVLIACGAVAISWTAATAEDAPEAVPGAVGPVKANKPRLKRLQRAAAEVDNAILDEFVRGMSSSAQGQDGQWSFKVDGVELMVISDEATDRMRIMTPITEADKLSKDELMVLLEANFDRALDAKYSVWQNVVWGTYTHPLSVLDRAEFESAARQVAALSLNYGTTFASIGVVLESPDP